MLEKNSSAQKHGHRLLRIIIRIIIVLLLILLGYVAYVFLSYKRIPDNQQLDVSIGKTSPIQVDTEYKIVSFNAGFGAYEPDYSFFMDGGTQSWAWSKDRLEKNMQAMTDYLSGLNPDLLILQEVDLDATRSYHVDEKEILSQVMKEGSSVFAVNFDSAFLFYPFTQPHGKSKSGLFTMCNYDIDSAIRRQLPVEDSVMKIVDLDRCYSKSYLPVNGKQLVLYNVHLSAYSSNGNISDEQLGLLLEDMMKEYEAGNYILGGGDMNKDLLGDSSEYFGIKGDQYTWAKPLNTERFAGKPLHLVCSSNAPSCRVADAPYSPQQFVVLIDGFIVSDNVEVISNTTLDTGFQYSDHNPVEMVFKLVP